MRMPRRRPSRPLFAVSTVLAGVVAIGCAPQPGPDDWTLEPLSFETSVQDDPLSPRPASGSAPRTDYAFGFHTLSDDGAGGFWAVSGSSWLHVSADDRTLARFDAEPDGPLSAVTAMDALSPTELVVVRDDTLPTLSVLDTSTMTVSDVPGEAPSSNGGAIDFGDYAFADVATDAVADSAVVVRLAPRPDASLDVDVLRISLADGTRTLVHTEQTAWSESGSDLPEVDVDVDDSGSILLATPDARIVLDADGTELRRMPQSASHPRVAAASDGTALWWGDEVLNPDAPTPDAPIPEPTGVIVGGSDAARASIEARTTGASANLFRTDALVLSDAEGEHPLPFLHGANVATWTGSSWIVATGGEGDGVLVRLRTPTG